MGRILVTGASGQIGSELAPALRERISGPSQVIASDVREVAGRDALSLSEGPFEHVDCTDARALQDVVRRHDVDVIYHLAALLSAVAEEKPQAAWSVNMNGLYSVLEVAQSISLRRVLSQARSARSARARRARRRRRTRSSGRPPFMA